MSTTGKQLYSVDSLSCAAAILAAGVSLTRIDSANPRRVVFLFSDQRVPELISQFHLGQLQVDARSLMARFEDLRTLVKRNPA